MDAFASYTDRTESRKQEGEQKYSPIISIIMPTYNRVGFIEEAINSIAIQSFPRIQLIVVDDGSTDGTCEKMREIMTLYPEIDIRFCKQEHAGISAARNRGIVEAEGEWIGFLDSDDLWHKHKARKQIEYLERHPECEILFTRYENFMDPNIDRPGERQIILSQEVDKWYLASAMVRKNLFGRCGHFSLELERWEDSEWVTRAKILGVDISHCLEESLYYRRIHGNNVSLGDRPGLRQRIGVIFSVAIRNANERRFNNEDIRTDTGI